MKEYLDAKREFSNLFILLKQNPWFNSICNVNLLEPINELTKVSKSKLWEYDNTQRELVFRNISLKSLKHHRPSKIKPDGAEVSVAMGCFYKGRYDVESDEISDIIHSLGVKFSIRCDYYDIQKNDVSKAESYWHLDKHNPKLKIDTIHPLFHFEFGGFEKSKAEGLDYGNFIILDTPRIMHPPLDIVLGIDFIIRNFYTYKESKSLLVDNEKYNDYIKNAKYRLWRPYALALASNFEEMNEFTIDTSFAQNIIECPNNYLTA